MSYATARLLLGHLGIDCASDGMAETPRRFTQALAELTAGLRADPGVVKELLSRTFEPPGPEPQLILVRDIQFTSVCEHHLLPFTGTATVGYLPQPGARVVGVSKIPRLVEVLAARPQMQERLGYQVVSALDEHLATQGSACVLDALHTCMTLRGARSRTARMTTSNLSGEFLEDGRIREEFLALRPR